MTLPVTRAVTLGLTPAMTSGMPPAPRRARALPAALLAATLAAPLPAAAQGLVDATNLDGILAIAKDYGDAVLEKDSTGDPMVSGTIGQTQYAVFFYGCTDGADCTTIQFMSSYVNPGAVDSTAINTWNAEKRFGKAFLDDEGDPVIEMNVNLWSGVSENNLNDTFDWWRVVIESFEEYIGFEHATDDAPAAETPVTREAEAPTPAPATGNPTAQGIGLGTLGGGAKVKVNR